MHRRKYEFNWQEVLSVRLFGSVAGKRGAFALVVQTTAGRLRIDSTQYRQRVTQRLLDGLAQYVEVETFELPPDLIDMGPSWHPEY
ncbi:MAG: hypothetical protein JXO22_08595 [Phycisphaerae bacterium]|nr:hypothetical protein [Phycisphaerae bacterium]